MITVDELMDSINTVKATPQQAKEINNDNTISFAEKQSYRLDPQAYEETKKTRLPELTAGEADTIADPKYTAQMLENVGFSFKSSFSKQWSPRSRENLILVPKDLQERVEKENEKFREQMQKNKGSVTGAFFKGVKEGYTEFPRKVSAGWNRAAAQRELFGDDYVGKFMDLPEGSPEEQEALNKITDFIDQNKEALSEDGNTWEENTAYLVRQSGPVMLKELPITAAQAAATAYTGGLGAAAAAGAGGVSRFIITYNDSFAQEKGNMFWDLYNTNQSIPEDQKMSKDLMKGVAEKYGRISASIEAGFDAVLAGTAKGASLGIKKIFSKTLKESAEKVIKENLAKTVAREGVSIASAGVEELSEEIMQNAIQEFMKIDAAENKNITSYLKLAQTALGELFGFGKRTATGELTEQDKYLIDKVLTPTAVLGAFSSAVGGAIRGEIESEKQEAPATPQEVDTVTPPPPSAPTQETPKQLPAVIQEINKQAKQERAKRVWENIKNKFKEKFGKKEATEQTIDNISNQEVADVALETVAEMDQEEVLQQEAEVATADLIEEVSDNETIVNDIAEQEQTNPLKKEDAQAYNALKENSRNEDERPTLYYVDTDTAKEVIAALEATDNEELKTVVNSSDIAQKIEQAEQNGQDVEVSPEVWEEVLGDKKLFQIAKNGTAVYKDTLTPKQQKELVSKVYENNPDLHQSLEDKSSMVSRAYDVLSQNMSEEQALANAAWLDTQANALWNAMSPEAQAEYESKEAFKSSVMPEIRQVDEIEGDGKLHMETWHGGPKLDGGKFNLKYAGKATGQAHGVGVYVTKDRAVGNEYRIKISSAYRINGQDITDFFNKLLRNGEEEKAAIIEDFMMIQDIPEMEDFKDNYSPEVWNWFEKEIYPNIKGEAKLYKVEIPEIETFIKEDLPFDEQSDIVKKALKKASKDVKGYGVLKKAIKNNENGRALYQAYGKDIFADLKGYEGGSFETQLAATENLINYGIEGISYYDKNDGDSFAVFNPDKAVIEQTFYQRTRGVIAGAFTPSLNLIELSKAQNVNTFMHETGHWVENFLTNLRASGKMNERLTKQWDNYMAKLGVEGEMTTAQRERFTEDMSTYVATGKLPDSKLGSLFDFMRNMIMSVWKIIRHRRISQPVRDFFDTLFFTDQEIDNMRLQNKIGLLNKPAGWSNAAYDTYVDIANSVKNETMTRAIGNVAKTEKLRETEEYKKQKQAFYNEKVAELENDPKYQLRQSIIDNPIYSETIPASVKLDKRFVTKNENAQTLDEVVAVSDFETADELLDFLQKSKDINIEAEEYATDMADEWLAKTYPDITETVQDISDDVLNKVKTNVYNHMILAGKDENMFKSIYNNLVADAEAEIANTSISIMSNPGNFTSSVNSLLNQYRVAEFNNNQKKMADLQRRLAVANYMVHRAKELQRQMKRFSKHFRKYTRKPKSGELSQLTGKAWDIIHSILNNFGFTARKPFNDAKTVAGRIEEFVGEVLNNSEYTSVFETEDERLFLSNPDDTALRSLSTEDFQRLDKDLRTFENLAIEDKGYKDQAKQDELENDVEELKQYRHGKTKDIGAVSSIFRMMEHEAAAMLPNDLNVKYQLPLQDGFARAANFTNQMWNKVNAVSEKLNKKFKRPFMINGHTFSTNNLLMMMLHSGNPHNFTSAVLSVADKFNIPDLTDEQFLDIIRQAPDEFRVAANEIWAEFAKTTQPILEVGRELNGQEMKIVKPEPIDFGDGGTKLTGGYFPAQKVDYKKSLVEEIMNTFKSSDEPKPFDGMFPVYKNKLERIAPHSGLDLDGSSVYGFIARTGQYLHIALPAKKTSKFYSTARDKGAISDSEYNFFHSQIKDSLQQTGIDGLIQFGALNMRASQLGLNPTTALLQGSIVVTSMAENSIQNTVKSLMEEIPHILNPLENGISRAKELSPYMRQRYENVSKSFFGEVQNTFTAKLGEKPNGKVVNTAKNIYGMMMGAISFLEAPMSIVAWKAAYLDARAKGMTHEQAVLKGDSIVRRFAGESMQGSSSKFYKSGYVRAFIPYMSYTMNIAAAVYAQARSSNAGSIARYAGALLATYALEQTIRSALKYHSADDEEKKKLGDKYIIDQLTSIPNFLAEITGTFIPLGGAISNKLKHYYEHHLEYFPNTLTFDEAHPLQFITKLGAGCIDIVKYMEYKNSGDEKKAEKAKKLAINDFGKGLGVNTYQLNRWFNKFVELLQEKE